MPVLAASTFQAPWWLRNAHLQTCWPTLFRRLAPMQPECLEITTPDDDFLELEIHRAAQPNGRALILSHGLEGSARSKYNLGLAHAANLAGWDVVCRHFRGCGSRMNRRFRLYHSGETDDLRTVVNWAAERWSSLALSGVSAGGNQTLRYLGQPKVHPAVERAVAFSVPCDLGASCRRMQEPSNRLYLERFLRTLRGKIRLKDRQFPGRLDVSLLEKTRDFLDFDNYFTAPMFGFRDAEDYYTQASSLAVLDEIRVPTLLVTSLDDPFLAPSCYPHEVAERNPAFHLELTHGGGHVGFRAAGAYWSEQRAMSWLDAKA